MVDDCSSTNQIFDGRPEASVSPAFACRNNGNASAGGDLQCFFATACAFRRHPARTGTLRATDEIEEPFGLGSTMRVPGSIDANEAGDKLKR
jgi:hypothetical protein